MNDENQITSLFSRYQISFSSDGKLREVSDGYCLLNKNDTKDLYLAMKEYFENDNEVN